MSIPREITELVANSGNNFHSKVARWLQSDGWQVTVSPYYLDQAQQKAREIDLVAEKLWPLLNPFGTQIGQTAIRLFVECKFIPTYSVFWFADKDLDAAKALVCAGGLFRPNNTYTDKHHYLAQSKRVAKLYATSVGRNSESDPYYKALNQVLNAMVSMRDAPLCAPLFEKTGDQGPTVLLEFPVVVCSSYQQMYSVDFYADSPPERVVANFQLETQYAYVDKQGRQKDEHLLIDFTEFDQLPSYTAALKQDVDAAAIFARP
jgi:hypothetical protein